MLDIDDIKNLIATLENRGIDVSLEKRKIYGAQNNMGSAAIFLSQNNSELKDVYNSLVSKLEKSDLLLSAYNYCNSIEPNVLDMLKKHKDEINLDELNSYISKIEDYLINLKDSNITNSNSKYSKIFKVVYDLIDAEIIKTNRSTLYDFIKSKNIDIRYINSILCSEINDINNDGTYRAKQLQKYLNNIIAKTNNNGLNNNYFNLEIIKLLLMHKSSYNAYEELSFEFNGNFAYYTSHYLNHDDINNISSEIDKYAISLPSSKIDQKKSKKNLIKRSIASALAAIVALTGAYGLERGAKKISTFNSYIKTTEITSPLDHDVTQEEVVFQGDNYPSEQYIQVVTPWTNRDDNYISRTVQKYDVTYLNLPDLENLDNIDLDSLDVIPDIYEEKVYKDEIGDIQKYNKNIRELVNVDYEHNGKGLAKPLYFSLIALIISVLMFIKSLYNESYHKYSINRTPLKEIIDFYIKNKNDFQNHYAEYKKLVDKLLESLSANQELLNLFNKIYKENINLISNRYGLEKDIDGMIDSLKNDQRDMEMTLSLTQKIEEKI